MDIFSLSCYLVLFTPFLILLGVLVRFIGCIFSPELRGRVKKHPILHIAWVIVGSTLTVATILSLDLEFMLAIFFVVMGALAALIGFILRKRGKQYSILHAETVTIIISLIVIVIGLVILLEVPYLMPPERKARTGVRSEQEVLFDALHAVGTNEENEDTWAIINKGLSSDNAGEHLFIIGRLSDQAKYDRKLRAKIIPLLINLSINDKDDAVRKRAMSAISSYPETAGVTEAIINMLKDKDEGSRILAVHVIMQKRIKEAIPALKEAATKEENSMLKQRLEEAAYKLEKAKKWGPLIPILVTILIVGGLLLLAFRRKK